MQPVNQNFAFRFFRQTFNRLADLFWSFVRFFRSLIIPAANFVKPAPGTGSKIDPNMKKSNVPVPVANVPKQELVCDGDVCYIRKK